MKIFKFLITLTFAMFTGASLAIGAGVNPYLGVGAAVGGSALMSFVPQPQNSLNAVVLKELFVSEVIKGFRHANEWLNTVSSRDEFVNNNVINLTEIGVDPTVIINNTTYPINTVGRTDAGATVALNKFETENTKITDDELYGIPYDKKGSVLEQHKLTLEEQTAIYGLHSVAPAADADKTPLVLTTGADNGSGRKRLVSANIISLKKKFDLMKMPLQGRVLVLCSDHIEDLLLEDKNGNFAQIYHNAVDGKISKKFYGFEIYEQAYNPVYLEATGVYTKKAFGAAANANDCNASTAFYAPHLVKARGDVAMYYSDATTNPKERESVVGFRLWHLVLPKTADRIGALVSAVV